MGIFCIQLPVSIYIIYTYFRLTIYSMVTPFDAFEILCIWTYYENGTFAP